jgi:glycine/D-amino acid oxidase-like deaminating enzyme
LKIRHENVQYQDYIATKIIFCEGAAAIKNPYFNWLPFNLDKGELLLVDIPNLDWRHILKHKIAIVPLSDTEGGQKDRYWVGATNDWDFENALPTTANRALIEHELENILQLPFSVVGHLAAIRPTVRDRRPFIGLHPNFASLSIFNGFGTKGASLVPYWAHHFVEVLVEGKNLDPEVSIERMYFDK